MNSDELNGGLGLRKVLLLHRNYDMLVFVAPKRHEAEWRCGESNPGPKLHFHERLHT